MSVLDDDLNRLGEFERELLVVTIPCLDWCKVWLNILELKLRKNEEKIAYDDDDEED